MGADANQAAASRCERKVQMVTDMLNVGIKDNEIVALRKVNPTKAGTMADVMATMQKSLKVPEMALRQAGVQLALKRAS